MSDNSATAPQLQVFSETSSTGRGIRLVQSLSTECGVRSSGGGKAVWARISKETAARGDAELAALDDEVGAGPSKARSRLPSGRRPRPVR